MARILFAWELGAGIGYADRLSQIATMMAAEGHEPVFALRDICGPADFFKDKNWHVLQAPMPAGNISAVSTSFVPGSFADLLQVNCYGNADFLHRLVSAWHLLFMALRPDVVVCEYSPVVALAAWRRIPVIVMGHGYINPPSETELYPIFDPGATRQVDQERLLENVREVQRRIGGPLPDTLPPITGGTAQFVTAFAETDPYGQFRGQKHAGPIEWIDPPQAPPTEPRVYAYLSGSHPQIRMLLQGIADTKLPGEAYVKKATPEMKQYLRERNVQVYDKPPPLAATVNKASVIFHHGGAATLATAMGAGRPQVLWSEVADQQVSATMIDKLGMSVHGRRRLGNAAQLTKALRDLAVPEGDAAKRAMAYAGDIQRRGEHGSITAICTAIRGFAD